MGFQRQPAIAKTVLFDNMGKKSKIKQKFETNFSTNQFFLSFSH